MKNTNPVIVLTKESTACPHPICGFKSERPDAVVGHVLEMHPGWAQECRTCKGVAFSSSRQNLDLWVHAHEQVNEPRDGEGRPAARTLILDEANGLINGDRQADYGHPSENFQRIADIWNATLGGKLAEPLKPSDVAILMAGLKVARTAGGYKRDTAVDLAGYAALYGELGESEKS